MSAATRLLERLERVRPLGRGRWIAACPAHDDRSPSLSVRELDDGRVLLHDFGGCETGQVLTALGLGLTDLFDQPLTNTSGRPSRSRIPASDLLELVAYEIDTAGIVLMQIIRNKSCNEAEWERLVQAVQRINRARMHIHGR